jgi:hypothetical protein
MLKTNKQIIAEVFNKHFITTADNINKNIDNSHDFVDENNNSTEVFF